MKLGGRDSVSYDKHGLGALEVFRYDPRPITSSISCSTARCAWKLPVNSGRVNENGCAELSVTIPSNGPAGPMVPSGNMAGRVSNPTARPLALDGAMFADNEFPGRLAFALLSLLVVASALKWLMKSLHETVYLTERLEATTPSGNAVALGQAMGLGVPLGLGVALALGAGPPVEERKRIWIVIGSLNSDS